MHKDSLKVGASYLTFVDGWPLILKVGEKHEHHFAAAAGWLEYAITCVLDVASAERAEDVGALVERVWPIERIEIPYTKIGFVIPTKTDATDIVRYFQQRRS